MVTGGRRHVPALTWYPVYGPGRSEKRTGGRWVISLQGRATPTGSVCDAFPFCLTGRQYRDMKEGT